LHYIKKKDGDFRHVQFIPEVLKLVTLMTVHLVQIWILKAAGNQNNFISFFSSISCDKTYFK
jgi:hypothetical protein